MAQYRRKHSAWAAGRLFRVRAAPEQGRVVFMDFEYPCGGDRLVVTSDIVMLRG